MPSLCVSVCFLDPWFHGVGDSGPEWPPSPMRVYQAMVAGARAACRGAHWSREKARAFGWLERQPAPCVIAPRAYPMRGHKLHVPSNDSDREPDRQQRLLGKTVCPHFLGDGDTVHYVWPLAAGDLAEHAEEVRVISREARHVLTLGWGIDHVVCNARLLTDDELARLVGVRWYAIVASRGDQIELRTPVPGTLGNLEEVHASRIRSTADHIYRPRMHPSVFRYTAYAPESPFPPRPYVAFELVWGDRPPGQGATATVAGWVRDLVMANRDDFSSLFEDDPSKYLAGNVGRTRDHVERFSYLPLPSIGHPHSDGRIRRVLVAEGPGSDGRRAGWAGERLRHQPLRADDGRTVATLTDLTRNVDRVVRLYTGSGTEWATVTPVILPGHDRAGRREGSLRSAERLFLKALEYSGIPVDTVSDFTLRKAPMFSGSEHPRAYARPEHLRGYGSWHVHLRLRVPFTGPLAVGVGRHYGLGLLARTVGSQRAEQGVLR